MALMSQRSELWHGTVDGYRGRGCRCEPCRGASSGANKKRHEEFKVWLAEIKDQPCADCGIKYPTVCMDLDHRDPSTKLFIVGSSAMRSRASLVAEAAKCDVVCANCHRLRTAKQWAEGAITPGRPRKQTNVL
jgi:hypothetical protein